MQTTTVGVVGKRYERPLTATARAAMRAFMSRRALHGRGRAHLHLVEDLADGGERAAHVLRIKPADAADAKTVRDGELARVDHIPARLELVVEILEHEGRVGRHAER